MNPLDLVKGTVTLGEAEELEKARYVSRKKVGGKWQYKYARTKPDARGRRGHFGGDAYHHAKLPVKGKAGETRVYVHRGQDGKHRVHVQGGFGPMPVGHYHKDAHDTPEQAMQWAHDNLVDHERVSKAKADLTEPTLMKPGQHALRKQEEGEPAEDTDTDDEEDEDEEEGVEKAGGHKYTSRRKGSDGKWIYTYEHPHGTYHVTQGQMDYGTRKHRSDHWGVHFVPADSPTAGFGTASKDLQSLDEHGAHSENGYSIGHASRSRALAAIERHTQRHGHSDKHGALNDPGVMRQLSNEIASSRMRLAPAGRGGRAILDTIRQGGSREEAIEAAKAHVSPSMAERLYQTMHTRAASLAKKTKKADADPLDLVKSRAAEPDSWQQGAVTYHRRQAAEPVPERSRPSLEAPPEPEPLTVAREPGNPLDLVRMGPGVLTHPSGRRRID